MSSSSSWCTVESDPAVFTELITQIGVKGLQVEELYDLDPAHLERVHPVFGLIFLFKYQPSPLDASTQTLINDRHPLNDDIYFAKQMITNACGTQAILNLLLNIDQSKCDANGITLGDEIKNFKEFTQFLPADMRGEAISNSELIRAAHNGFARPEPFIFEEKKSRSRDDDSADAFHFVGYIPINGRLYELDGLRSGPILINNNGGAVLNDHNWMAAARVAIQSRLAQYGSKEIRFNLMAIIGDQRERMKKQIAEMEAEIERVTNEEASVAASSSSSSSAPSSDATPAAAASSSSSSTSVAMDTTDAASSSSSSSSSPPSSARVSHLQSSLSDLRSQLSDEVAKMSRWHVDNSRRRHNYVPFIFNLLRLLAEKGKLAGLVESAVKSSAERSARTRAQAGKRKEAEGGDKSEAEKATKK